MEQLTYWGEETFINLNFEEESNDFTGMDPMEYEEANHFLQNMLTYQSDAREQPNDRLVPDTDPEEFHQSQKYEDGSPCPYEYPLGSDEETFYYDDLNYASEFVDGDLPEETFELMGQDQFFSDQEEES